MSQMGMQASIGEPWPYGQWWNYAPVIPAPCDHCLCLEPEDYEMHDRTEPHKRCCHCRKVYMVRPSEPSDD